MIPQKFDKRSLLSGSSGLASCNPAWPGTTGSSRAPVIRSSSALAGPRRRRRVREFRRHFVRRFVEEGRIRGPVEERPLVDLSFLHCSDCGGLQECCFGLLFCSSLRAFFWGSGRGGSSCVEDLSASSFRVIECRTPERNNFRTSALVVQRETLERFRYWCLCAGSAN